MSRYTCLHVVAEGVQRIARLRGIDDGGRRGPWAPWLRRSDDQRVGWGVVIRTWPPERGRAPGANALPDGEVVRWLREATERSFDDYVTLAALAGEVGRAALVLLAERGVRRTPNELSEILATRLLAASAELGRCPTGRTNSGRSRRASPTSSPARRRRCPPRSSRTSRRGASRRSGRRGARRRW